MKNTNIYYYYYCSYYLLLESNLVMVGIVFDILSLLLLSLQLNLLDATSVKKNKTRFGKRRLLLYLDLSIK